MPKKNITELSFLQRLHYSLKAQTFRTVLLLSLLISVAAVAFGYYVYSAAVRREFRTRTHNLSNAAALILETPEVVGKAERVVAFYNSMSPEERETLADHNAPALSRLDEIRDAGFLNLQEKMQMMAKTNDAMAAYLAFLDLDNSRMVFIADSDRNEETFCPPGCWDQLKEEDCRVLIEGRQELLDPLYGVQKIQACLIDLPQYGYRCTAGTIICYIGRYPIMVFFDTDMRQAAAASRTFLLLYFSLIAVITLTALILAVHRMNKTTVQPINQLAAAARDYAADVMEGQRSGGHFAGLDIRTGNEIENLSLTMKGMETDLTNYVENLTRITAEKERIGAELALATRIQADVLPNIFPAFPERSEFDVYATMDPAKEVGGDFYDFFLIDEDHLALVIADVSGKGVPAALFMMAAKNILANNAAMGKSPARILTDTNTAVCSNNREEMFITVWLGILEISTGRLTCANAGHEYPALMRPDGSFELYRDRHGFVIGGMEHVQYKEYEIRLEPGARVFVYTDGVSEATDAAENLFGLQRMLDALNAEKDVPLQQLLENVREAVDDFVGEAEQFDDLTMLCLEYRGVKPKSSCRELSVEARLDSIPAVTDFVNAELEAADCSVKVQTQIDIVIDELFSNIARYAYAPETGSVLVRVELEQDPPAVVLTFIDRGRPYDPLSAEEPDVTAAAEDRPIGGLGVFLVKKIMDELRYEYRDGQNILRVKKCL